MLKDGVESPSDSIHRIHQTRTDSDGKVYVLFVRHFEKFTHVGLAYRGQKVVPMESVGSIGDESIAMEKSMFVRYLEKFHSCQMRELKVVPMESIGSLDTERFPWKSAFSNREEFSLKLIIFFFYCSEYLIGFMCVCVCACSCSHVRFFFLFCYVC